MNDVSAKTELPPADRRRTRLSLRWRIVGFTGISMLSLTVLLVAVFASQTRGVIREDLRDRARLTAEGLAKNLAYSVSSGDIGLQVAVDGLVRDTPDILYILFRDDGGAVLAEARHAALRERGGAVLPAAKLEGDRPSASERELELSGLAALEVVVPIAYEEKPVGLVQLGVRTDRLTSRISVIVTRAVLLGLAALAAGAIASYLSTRMLVSPLERLTAAAAGMAGGNLRQDVRMAGRDEIAELAASFQSMADGLREMVADLGGVAGQLESEGREILQSISQHSAMAAQQASAINETTTTVTEIAQSSRQATEHADRVIQVAQRSEDLSIDGKKVVEDVVAAMLSLGDQVKSTAAAMAELSRKAQQIGDVVATVKDLAEQSNVLALNAAIEASRAGEHGKGFSVVALEMRNLAEQSKAAAAQVKVMLGEVERGTQDAVRASGEEEKRAQAAISLARSAGAAIEGLAETIRESSLAAREIAQNTRQQTIGVEQIVIAINQLSAAMGDAVAGSERIEKGTGNLNTLAKRLLQTVTRYQV